MQHVAVLATLPLNTLDRISRHLHARHWQQQKDCQAATHPACQFLARERLPSSHASSLPIPRSPGHPLRLQWHLRPSLTSAATQTPRPACLIIKKRVPKMHTISAMKTRTISASPKMATLQTRTKSITRTPIDALARTRTLSTSPRMVMSRTKPPLVPVRVPKGTYLSCPTDSIPRVESPHCDSEPDKIFNLMWRVEKVREKRDWLKDTIRFYTDGLQSAEAVLQSTKAKLLTAEAKLDALRDVLRKSEDDGVTDLDSNDYLDSDREDAHDEAPIGVCQSVRVDESPSRDWEPNNVVECLLLLEEGREERDQLKDTLRLIEDALHAKEAEVRSTEAKLLTTEAKLDVVRDIIW